MDKVTGIHIFWSRLPIVIVLLQRTMSDSSLTQTSYRGMAGKWPAQLHFEKKRDEVLSQIPQHIKAVFGQAVLAGWSGKAYPALVLNPFDVPPSPAREQWKAMFQNVSMLQRFRE
jgi:hypothetical protein